MTDKIKSKTDIWDTDSDNRTVFSVTFVTAGVGFLPRSGSKTPSVFVKSVSGNSTGGEGVGLTR